MRDERALLDIYRRHLVDDVMAWWLTHGPDDERGGVLTCWSNDGRQLVSEDKYIWSQGRWIWLMASLAGAASRGLIDLDAGRCLERAIRTARFLRDHAFVGRGITAYVTDRAGRPKEASPGIGLHSSIFADLFVALGFAALGRETGDPVWGWQADEILAVAHAAIAAGPVPTEPYPIRPGFWPLSLPMILVNVGAEVHRATGSPGSAAIVAWAVAQIERRFLVGSDLREMEAADPADGDTLLLRHRTPGHVLECCWFLADATAALPAGTLAGSRLADMGALAEIGATAFARGQDQEHGGLLRYVDVDGGVPRGRTTDDRYERLVAQTWDTKLWWPHAEALYALLLLGRSTGRSDLLAAHETVHDYVMRTFAQGPGLEWIQIRDRAGAPLEATVALPVKDPFHIARALLLLVELLAAEPERPR